MSTILESLTTERNILSIIVGQLDTVIARLGTNGNGATSEQKMSKGAPAWLRDKAKHARAIAKFRRTMRQKRLAKQRAEEAAATFNPSEL